MPPDQHTNPFARAKARWQHFSRVKKAATIGVAVLAVLFTIGAIGAAVDPPPKAEKSSDSSAQKTQAVASGDESKDKAHKPSDAVDGDLSKDCDLKCTSPDAARALKVDDVYCVWSAGAVHIHAQLTNTMIASVNLSITPKYTIKNGGQHGTSFGSDIEVRLLAGQHLSFDGNAGSPEAVPAGAPIDRCEPHLHDIDIG